MKKSLALRAGALLSVGALALSACGGSDSDSASDGGFKAPDIPMVKSLGDGRVRSTSSPGPVTPRTAAPLRSTTG